MPSSDTSELALVALDVFGHGLATARTLRANYGTPVLADLQALLSESMGLIELVLRPDGPDGPLSHASC